MRGGGGRRGGKKEEGGRRGGKGRKGEKRGEGGEGSTLRFLGDGLAETHFSRETNNRASNRLLHKLL